MTGVHPSFSARRRMAGLSLIEMMIALVMALIVSAGIISVFTSTSSSNRVQAQMAALQEEGRFAIHSLRTDLADANGGYCTNTGGNAGVSQGGSGLYMDWLRAPIVYSKDADAITNSFADNTTSLAETAPFELPSFLYMRGYDCNTSTCTPGGLDTLVSEGLPAMGTAPGDRVRGASVLTIRYLRPGSGWAITESAPGSVIGTGPPFTITLGQLPGEDPPSDFTGSLALLADCSTSGVYSVSGAGGVLTFTGANSAQPNYSGSGIGRSALRVFDFAHDFQTVTYYLKVVCANGVAPCPGGATTGELVRRLNGVDSPLVRGVERLNFRYGIIDSNGNTRFLTANEVDTGAGGTIQCPRGAGAPDPLTAAMPTNGCLWRAVQTIQVNILMDGQTPLYTLTPAEMNYIYTPDGYAMEPPTGHAVEPNADQGFPNQLIRREFTTLVTLRNFNP